MTLPTATHIERTFLDLPEDRIVDGDRPDLLRGLVGSRDPGWPELLASPRVVIVSEAGAGKTYECQSQARRLWELGEAAFFLDLAQLASGDLRAMLRIEEETRLDAWLVAQSEHATFFLDSYDELKLSQGSFRQALTTLARAIRSNLGRVRIVMTTRPIPFDITLMRDLLRTPQQQQQAGPMGPEAFARLAMGEDREESRRDDAVEAPEWRIVALKPLNDVQIEAMARLRGVADPAALLADIRLRNAEEFARRPQDLIELCADWNAAKRIRTHRSQVAANIAIKLKPRTDRDKPEKASLSHERAIDGAARLALAMLLTRKLTLRYNASSDQVAGLETALDPAFILVGWGSEEIETLLERPLFGFATYGRVRFHHRSVLEYLAAERLRSKVETGMPLKALARLLFARTHQGTTVVRPSMRPLTGWLAAALPGVFRRVLEIEPEILLNHGDPESLSTGQRGEALQAYVERYGTGGWRGLDLPHIQTHRFADPGLADQINALWQTGIENLEVRCRLLAMVETGRIAGCADFAFARATDPEATPRERSEALDALVTLKDDRLEGIGRALGSGAPEWPDAIARDAIFTLFPGSMTVEDFARSLGRLRPRKRTVGDIDWRLQRVIEAGSLTQAMLEELREAVTALAEDGLCWEARIHNLTSSRAFLADGLAAICLGLLRAGYRSPALIGSTILALRLGKEEYRSREIARQLRTCLAGGDESLRAAVFWADDALMHRVDSGKAIEKRYYQPIYKGPIRLEHSRDAGWVSRALGDGDRALGERYVALEVLLRMGPSADEWDAHVGALRAAVSGTAQLEAHLDRRLTPAPFDAESARLEAEIAAGEQRAAQEREEARGSWAAFWQRLADEPDALFAPDQADGTIWDLWQVLPRDGDHSRSSGWNRRFLEQEFGVPLADRVRQALMNWWRRQDVTLASERDPDARNSGFVHWQLAVAAIAAEAEAENWAHALSPAEARLAARFAPVELNSFPSWLEPLALAQPQAVDEILGAELIYDLERPAAAGEWSALLQNLRDVSGELAAVFLPRLSGWLASTKGRVSANEHTGVATDRIARVVALLLRHGEDSDRELVRSIADEELSGDPGFGSISAWLPVLMRLDAKAGVDALERLFASSSVSVRSNAAAILGSLFGDRYVDDGQNAHDERFTPDLRLRLTRFAYRHVREQDDVEHDGPHAVGLREHAEHARRYLLGSVFETSGPEGWHAKLALAQDTEFADLRDRLVMLAQEKAAEDAEGMAYTDDQALAVDQHGEAPPATTHAMFAMLRDRLDDLDDLLLGDTSPREAWAAIIDERVMRRELAREIGYRANGVYSVDQEAATADEKETDIRLRVSSTGQQAVIELKLGNKSRSGGDLRDTIRQQLLAKYMAPRECRSGCLLITLARDRTWDHPDTGVSLDFPALISFLNEEAGKIMDEMAGAVMISVKGLDLRPRLATEKAAKAGRS